MTVTCIYCLQAKPISAFRHREHVMPRCFGTFRPDNLILREVVCDECNQYFGEDIELVLGRDSIEGILRYRYGIKPEKAPRSHKRLKFRVEAGELKGLIVIPKYSGVPGETDIEPVLQVGFYHKERQLPDYFEPQDIPAAKELKAQGYDISRERTIILMARNEQEMKSLLKTLKDKGMNVQPTEEMDWPEYMKRKNQTWTRGIITADQIVQRGFCKIAFNYLAHVQGREFALHEDFNGIRGCIRYGRGNSKDYFVPNQPPILHHDKLFRKHGLNAKETEGHLLVLEWRGSDLVALVSLFNQTTYLIRLAKRFSGIWRSISAGHHFDVESREINEMMAVSNRLLPQRMLR